jgi:hypothetical protein
MGEGNIVPILASRCEKRNWRRRGVHSFETLEIIGYGNKPVPNTFFRQQEETRHLGILFPGLGYTSHMPLLYYPGRLLLFQGADLLRVEYAYERNEVFHSLSGSERGRWMNADATAACSVALKRRSYDQVALIGKSIGTLVLGHLISTHPELDEPRCIWLTPLLRNERLRSQITQTRHRGLFVIGTADPHYDHAKLAAIQEATGGESIIIQGADHSMEIDGKVAESIQALQRIMLGIQSFLFGGKR